MTFGIKAKLIDYFEETWTGGIRRDVYREPLFAITEWNCYDRVKNGLCRTNNSLEGWHRSFLSQLGATHPTIWKFIEALLDQQSMSELEILQRSPAATSQPQRKIYRDLNSRICSIVEDFDNKALIKYVTSIAHNVVLNV